MTSVVPPSVLVFVVEDQEDILHLIEEILTEGGFAVTVAREGEKAMTMLDAEGARYHALVTDVNLGGSLTGWDVAKHAREVNDLLPVIYMTAASAHEWGSRGVPKSVLLLKPFAMSQVLTAVSQLVTAASAAAATLSASKAPDDDA